MKRFFNYWKNYNLDLPDFETNYLKEHGKINVFKRGEIANIGASKHSYWNFILSGAFIAQGIDISEKPTPCQLHLPNESFTTTQHPFTKRESTWEYRTILPSVVLVLKNIDIIYLQQNSPVFSEILHILKQRRLAQLEKIVRLCSIKNPYQRFRFYKTEFNPLVINTPHVYQRQFLAISNGSYYNYQHRYLHER